MTYIPHHVIDKDPFGGKIPLVNRGKVRDTYSLEELGFKDRYLVIVSDRISIFDFVLGTKVHLKGYVLNLTSTSNKKYLEKRGTVKTDLIAWGQGIDAYLPGAFRGNPDLWARATVVKKCKMIDYEMIARRRLTGSGYKDYLATGEVCGHRLPAGLHDGSELEKTIFTPSTKAKVGHDQNISRESVIADVGDWAETLTLNVFDDLYGMFGEVGLILADSKFEFGYDPVTMEIILCDEGGTPDSSRLWDRHETAEAELNKVPPVGYDKQFMRDAGKKLGINDTKKYDPAVITDAENVGNLTFSNSCITGTQALYMEIVRRLSDRILALNDPHLTWMRDTLLAQRN